MKGRFFIFLAIVSLLAVPLYFGITVKAQEAAALQVEIGVICKNVVDREPVDSAESFEAAVGKLFCFTKIVGAQTPIEITHVWYFGDVERGRVTLSVEAASWRTWSSKIIQTHEVGPWHVDVLGPDGTVLKTLNFTITQ